MRHKRLVILSVPFKRLTRVLLGEPVLGSLRQHCDVVIVGPFAEQLEFQSEFGGCATRFIEWKAPEKIRQPLGAFFAVSELLRMHGYWRRFRNKGMAYHLANSHLKFGADGHDERIPLTRRMVLFLISIVGMWSGAWRSLDLLIGPWLFNFSELRNVAQSYERVTLIQSASWGIQDRMLAWMGRQQKWHTLLIPYTTDQLACNGYLLSDFDAVCVQGPIENRYALQIHKIPPSRIVHLGSAWFRHMDVIVRELKKAKVARCHVRPRAIMLAGVSNTYFPRASERVVLEVLLRAIEQCRLCDVELIYRPVVVDREDREEIEDLWGSRNHLRLQWPQTSCLGMDQYGEGRMDADLSEYVAQLLAVDIVVTAGVTSLTIDAANIGIASISVVVDSTGILKRRHAELLFDSDGKFNDVPALPIVHEIDQLIPLVEHILDSPDQSKAMASQLAADWDYAETNFQETLIETVMG